MSRSKRSTRRPVRRSIVPLFLLLAALVASAVIAVLALSGSAAQRATIDSSAPGRLVVSEPTIDLGRVQFDVLAEARFDLANTGADPVRLVGAPRVRLLEGC